MSIEEKQPVLLRRIALIPLFLLLLIGAFLYFSKYPLGRFHFQNDCAEIVSIEGEFYQPAKHVIGYTLADDYSPFRITRKESVEKVWSMLEGNPVVIFPGDQQHIVTMDICYRDGTCQYIWAGVSDEMFSDDHSYKVNGELLRVTVKELNEL